MAITWTLVCKNTKLKQGSKGDAVKQLQTFLKSKGWYNYTIDGSYGKYTKAGVESFQKAYGLTVDGYFGPVSCAKVTSILNGVSSSTGVTISSAIQTQINSIINRTYSSYDEGLECFLVLDDTMLNAPSTDVISTGLIATETSSDDSDSSDDSSSDDDDDS